MSDQREAVQQPGESSRHTASGVRPTGPPGGFEPPPAPGSTRRRPAGGAPPGPRMPRTRRRADASTLAMLALAVPWFVYGLTVVGLVGLGIGALVGNVTVIPVLVMALWLASGALTLYGPTEIFLARFLLRARRPTPSERQRLHHAWHDVTTAAGRDGRGYQLFIEDSDELNAFAASGHVVTVTRKAVDTMPHHHLSAVLAHELGHHIGGHPWGNMLAFWYSVPARLLNRVLRLLLRLFVSIFSVVFAAAARMPALAAFIARLVTWALAAFVLVFVVLLMVVAVQSGQEWAPIVVGLIVLSPVLLPWLARRAEYRADRLAAQIGYGRPLIEVLEDWLRQGGDDARRNLVLRARLVATHPTLAARIKRLDAYLRKHDA